MLYPLRPSQCFTRRFPCRIQRTRTAVGKTSLAPLSIPLHQLPPPNYPPQGPPPGYAQTSGLSSTAAAAISYLTFIPAVIFLVLDPYKRDPYIRFHAFQSIGLNVVGFAIGLVFTFLFLAMHFVGMGLIVGLLRGLVDLLLFVAWLICIIQAAQGKWFKLPVIGDFAMNQSRQ